MYSGDVWSWTFDYYDISVDDRVILSGNMSRADLPAAVQAALDELQTINAKVFFNGANTSTNGFDIVASRDWYVGSGTLKFEIGYNSTDTTIDEVLIPPTLSGVAPTTLFTLQDRDIIESYQPENRLNVGLEWEDSSGWKVTGAVRSYGSYLNTQRNGDRQEIGAQMVVDVYASYEFNESASIYFGADNLLDEYPDRLTSGRARAGPLVDPATNTTIVSDDQGFFIYPNRSSPVGINGAFLYVGYNIEF